MGGAKPSMTKPETVTTIGPKISGELKTFKVELEIQVTRQDMIENDPEIIDMSEEDYVRQEIGWTSESFSGLEVKSIEKIKK